MVGSSLRLLPRGSRQRQREFRSRKSLTGRFRSVAEKNASNRVAKSAAYFMSLRRGDDDYYYYIICVIVLRAKAEHALDTRYSADEQRATTTTRVLDGCCVPAGVTLQSSSSYALARSLAHPDRAGEPRTRPPTEDTPHIDRNLARSEPRPPISLTITNRRQGHTSRRYPRAQQRERSILAQLPGVPFRTLNRGPQRCPSLDRDTRYYFCRCSPISRFSRYRFIYRVQ